MVACTHDGSTKESNWFVRYVSTPPPIQVLRFFSFFNSTPSSVVARELDSAFFSCSADGSISLVSTLGIHSALARVRMPHVALIKFVRFVPVAPDALLSEAGMMVEKLKSRGMLKEVSLEDVIGELKERILSEPEFEASAHWMISLSQNPRFDPSVRAKLRDSIIYCIKANSTDPASSLSTDRIVPLSTIDSYFNPRSAIPPDLPLPSTTLPFSTSKSLPLDKLSHALGLRELTPADWIAFLVSPEMASESAASSEMDLTRSPHFAEKVLGALAKAWNGMSPQSQARVYSLLSNVACIPSRSGMVRFGLHFVRSTGIHEPSPDHRSMLILDPYSHDLSYAGHPRPGIFPQCLPLSRPAYRIFPKQDTAQRADGTPSSRPWSPQTRRSRSFVLSAKHTQWGEGPRMDRRRLYVSCLLVDCFLAISSGEGGCSDLVSTCFILTVMRYLVSVRETLTAAEIEKLKLTPGKTTDLSFSLSSLACNELFMLHIDKV